MLQRETNWIGICLLLFASALGYAAAPDTRPSDPVTWYNGNRYIWDAPLGWHEVYNEIFQRLPPEQAKSRSRFDWGDLLPLDCAAGEDKPRLTYVLAYATDETIGFYSSLPDITFLDLLCSELSERGLAQLHDCQAKSVAFPWSGISVNGLLKLLGDDSALPQLRHVEIEPQQTMPADLAARICRSRPTLESLQLTGVAVSDEWLRSLKGIRQIRGIRLYNTSITNTGLPALAELPGLTHVALAINRRVDRLDWLQEIRGLKELHLQGPTAWTNAWRFTTDAHAVLSDDVLKGIEKHPSIEVLVLESSDISDRGLKTVSSLPRLRVLVLKPPKDKRVAEAAKEWERADAKRRLYFTPPGYLAGWITGPTGEWVQVRGANPKVAP